jgi:glycosyltransferase involved in cell wall biosynthesis
LKILVASTHVPFIRGGGTMIVEDLAAELAERGHEVDVLTLPFWSVWDEMVEQMLALRLINVQKRADRLICIRTPSYLIEHENKVAWFIHHHRGAYDLWGTQFQDIPNSEEGLKVLASIKTSDNRSLREVKKLFTNSQVVSKRLSKFNQLDSTVLYPPLRHAERFRCRSYGDYIFYASRIATPKRQMLAVESMQFVKSGTRLVIAGSPDEPQVLIDLQELVKRLRLDDRVEIRGNWISEEEKVELFADALGSIYIPLDEDSYGYPTLESFQSLKPVITCTDSGGTMEIMEDGVNGFVCAPMPEAIAIAIDKLASDRAAAAKMGEAGLARMQAMNISWDYVCEQLVS